MAAHFFSENLCRELFHSTAIYQLWITLTTGFDGGPFNKQVISNLAGGCGFFLLGWAVYGVASRGFSDVV